MLIDGHKRAAPDVPRRMVHKPDRAGRLLAENGINEQEIAARKAFLEFGAADARRLAALAPRARKYVDAMVEELYAHFLAFDETRRFFRDRATLKRVKRLQKSYFLRLTSGRYGRGYIANRLLVGSVHERIGLVVKVYLGAYRRYLDSMAQRLLRGGAREQKESQAFRSLLKLVFLDIGLAIDTYVLQSERTIRAQNQQLETQYRQVQEANRLKSQFLANMSHELRTPLNAIIGFSELLHDGKTGPLGERQKAYLADSLDNARHLLGLINDVLDLAKVESGTMSFNREPLDVAEVVREARQAVESAAARKRIELRTEIQTAVGAPMLDRARLKQVLINYLSNAVKFTSDHGRVTIRIAGDETQLLLEVEDDGIGIKGEDLPRLFTQFHQIDGSSAKKYQGTGLGLAITRQVVEAQGGSVGVESTPGKGSRFYARLPLASRGGQAETPPPGEVPARPVPTEVSASNGCSSASSRTGARARHGSGAGGGR
jgi:signal transduction histidine kinase